MTTLSSAASDDPSPAGPTPALGDLVLSLPLDPSAWRELRLEPGEVLFHAGEPGDRFFVVAEGEIEVYVEDPSAAKVTLAYLGPGAYVGELALLDGGVRTASAAATAPSVLRGLARDDFMEQLGSSPALAGALVGPLSDRLRNVLGYLDHLISFSRQVSEGKYAEAQSGLRQQVEASKGDAARFYQSFVAMLDAVQAREAELRRELAELRILIDTEKHAAEVQEITDTDFFRQLEEDARRMRGRRGETSGS